LGVKSEERIKLMETTRIEGLTTFLVMDYLEKKEISPELTQQLENEVDLKFFCSCSPAKQKGTLPVLRTVRRGTHL
jgi:redox-regulated HSP33 family molecular chaperone